MVRGVAATATVAVLCEQSLTRSAVSFTVGDSTNACSVVVKDLIDATATNGVPLTFSSGVLRIEGAAARHRWTVIRLAAVNCIVGVIEEFPDAGPVNPELAAPPVS